MPIWYRKYQNTLLPHCMKDESVLIQKDSFITWYLSAGTFLGFLLLQLHEKEKMDRFFNWKRSSIEYTLLATKSNKGEKEVSCCLWRELRKSQSKDDELKISCTSTLT